MKTPPPDDSPACRAEAVQRLDAIPAHRGRLGLSAKCAMVFFFLTLLLTVTGCGRGDAKIQEAVIGTWVVHFEGNICCTNIISPNGGYAATVTGFPDGHVIRLGGTILARDGDLIETVTSDSETNEPLPMVVRGHIISLDAHQMITKWDAKQVTTTVAQKVE